MSNTLPTPAESREHTADYQRSAIYAIPQQSVPELESPAALPQDVTLAELDTPPMDLEHEYARERRDARYDDLTGLPGRRWLSERLDELGEQEAGNFALVFVDLDGLKGVNDSKGHEAGNVLLQTAANQLQAAVTEAQNGLFNSVGNEVDQVSIELAFAAIRLSGDEFVLLMKGVKTQEEVDVIISHAKAKLYEAGIAASMGGRPHVAGEQATDLLKDVDQKMYVEKMSHKAEAFRQLPWHKRLAAYAGTALIRMAGVNPPRL